MGGCMDRWMWHKCILNVWMYGHKFMMDGWIDWYKLDEWMDKWMWHKCMLDGWMDEQYILAGRYKLDGWVGGWMG